MKGTTALIFVLLASLVLLSHVVVLHHHHESEVCFTKDHCQADCGDHDDDTTGYKHGHDGESEVEFCVLKTEFVIASNELKQKCKWFVRRVDIDAGFDTFQPVQHSCAFFHELSPKRSQPRSPLIGAKFVCLIASIHGLRPLPLFKFYFFHPIAAVVIYCPDIWIFSSNIYNLNYHIQ